MTKFKNDAEVIKTIKEDLDNVSGTSTQVELYSDRTAFSVVSIADEFLIDNIDVEIKQYAPDSDLLRTELTTKNEHEVFSNLLKTNCPVTGQPDWGTVHIKYVSDKHITEKSLLEYIISYRGAMDFHEVCCEKFFSDIYNLISPVKLYVKCYYTRRGGIDINPLRYIGYKIKSKDFSDYHWRQ